MLALYKNNRKGFYDYLDSLRTTYYIVKYRITDKSEFCLIYIPKKKLISANQFPMKIKIEYSSNMKESRQQIKFLYVTLTLTTLFKKV